MKEIKTWMTAAALAVAMGSAANLAPGQSILDEGLDARQPAKADAGEKAKPAPAAPAAAEVQPAAEPPKPTRPNLPDLVSPDAAKTVDDQDLLNKLTGKANVDSGQGGNPMQKMQEITDRMGQAQARLAQQKDPGLVTQETQRRIVTDLDVLIEYLKQQQQKGGGQGQSSASQQAQARQQSQGQQQGQGMGGTQAATDSNMRAGSASTPGDNGTNFRETNTGWGSLPPGDRELVAHGASEHYLPEYKDMIKKYYEALAELGKSSKGQ